MKRLTYALAVIGLLAGGARAEEMHYVIKVTPTLIYVDAGERAGVQVGDVYLILQTSDEDDKYAQVGEVRVVRVFEEFSIAEITYVAAGEEIEVLQRAISMAAWEEMAQVARPMEREVTSADAAAPGTRSVCFFGGGDWSKQVGKVRWEVRDIGDKPHVVLRNVDATSEASLGLRLGKVFREKWRFSLTYRISGKPLGGEGDITQLSIEADVHYLLLGNGRGGPYVGVGSGMHYLSWDVDYQRQSRDEVFPDESTIKPGANLVAGLHAPLAQGRWSLLAEAGYQWMPGWKSVDEQIKASNVRTYVGLGRNF